MVDGIAWTFDCWVARLASPTQRESRGGSVGKQPYLLYQICKSIDGLPARLEVACCYSVFRWVALLAEEMESKDDLQHVWTTFLLWVSKQCKHLQANRAKTFFVLSLPKYNINSPDPSLHDALSFIILNMFLFIPTLSTTASSQHTFALCTCCCCCCASYACSTSAFCGGFPCTNRRVERP